MQIIIYRATLWLFQHTSRQSLHFNQLFCLKVGKIVVTPQTRNPHAIPIVGQPFGPMTCNHMTSVLLILQFSSDTPIRINAKLGKFSATVALDLVPGSIQTPMPGLIPS